MKFVPALLIVSAALAQSWVSQDSGTAASLRGVSAVSETVAWASGSGGVWLRTADGGSTWRVAQVVGADKMDFRGIRAIDDRTAYLMSAGAGEASRIYKTIDTGEHWTLQFTNTEPKGFFDSIAFWDAVHGIVAGDPVDGGAEILTTSDGGAHWQRQKTLPALPNEGSFAASNTCLFVRGSSEVWYVTGGSGAGRVFHSTDGGRSWTVAVAPVRSDSASAGIFSIAFADARRGIVVGGDYSKDKEDRGNIAITEDGGRTWAAPAERPKGFRSAAAYLPGKRMWIVTGTSGSDVSVDGGRTWRQFDEGSYNAMSFTPSGSGWAVGGRGRIARFQAASR